MGNLSFRGSGAGNLKHMAAPYIGGEPVTIDDLNAIYNAAIAEYIKNPKKTMRIIKKLSSALNKNLFHTPVPYRHIDEEGSALIAVQALSAVLAAVNNPKLKEFSLAWGDEDIPSRMNFFKQYFRPAKKNRMSFWTIRKVRSRRKKLLQKFRKKIVPELRILFGNQAKYSLIKERVYSGQVLEDKIIFLNIAKGFLIDRPAENLFFVIAHENFHIKQHQAISKGNKNLQHMDKLYFTGRNYEGQVFEMQANYFGKIFADNFYKAAKNPNLIGALQESLDYEYQRWQKSKAEKTYRAATECRQESRNKKSAEIGILKRKIISPLNNLLHRGQDKA